MRNVQTITALDRNTKKEMSKEEKEKHRGKKGRNKKYPCS
jgi:hypothetical protein